MTDRLALNRSEQAAESALTKKRAEAKAQEVIEQARKTMAPGEFHHFKRSLFPLIQDYPRPKGVRWDSKQQPSLTPEQEAAQAKADWERLFRKTGEAA